MSNQKTEDNPNPGRKSRVYIEFFSEEALENVMCLLLYHPDKIIFLGLKATMLTRKMESLQNFAALRSPDTELEFVEVPRNDLDECIATLQEVSDEYPEAVYELTGGSEMILIAFGFLSATKKLRTVRIDPYTSTEVRFIPGQLPEQEKADLKMSVRDNIVLHGGSLTRQTGSESVWRFTEDFKADIRDIWNIARQLKHRWNHYTAILEDLIKSHPADETGLFILPKAELKDSLPFFTRLNQAGKLRDFTIQPKRIRFRFKNASVGRIVSKTGNILELHVYEVASRRPDLFNDEVIGAVIDWNGDKTPEQKKEFAQAYQKYMKVTYDTVNEIDVILMRTVIPTFISCKSGRAGSLALHELQTVTHRFGGNYAKKALVMALPCDNSQSGTSFFKQRAKEMHIWVIDNVYDMSDETLLKRLIRIQGN